VATYPAAGGRNYQTFHLISRSAFNGSSPSAAGNNIPQLQPPRPWSVEVARRSKIITIEVAATTDREAWVSFAELEVPEPPRAAQVSWAEFETPDIPRAAFVSFAELEIPEVRAAFVSFAEIEVPNEPRAGFVSFAELEVPDIGGGGGGGEGTHYRLRRVRGMRTRHIGGQQ
jgi:hypothetical protein